MRALTAFESTWTGQYPTIGKNCRWLERWANVIPFFGNPKDIRKAIYTTNAIEGMNMSLRKIIKNRSLFPNEEAMTKLLYLALRNIKKKWTMPVRDWGPALNQFAIIGPFKRFGFEPGIGVTWVWFNSGVVKLDGTAGRIEYDTPKTDFFINARMAVSIFFGDKDKFNQVGLGQFGFYPDGNVQFQFGPTISWAFLK